jgi:GxxExxY protein
LDGGNYWAAIEVPKMLGPGLLEAAYEDCLCHELTTRRIPFERQKLLPLVYKGLHVGQGYRLDIRVANCVVVEIKAVEELLPRHSTQVLTYLRLGGWQIGLLMNFNTAVLTESICRIANNYREP